jgi:hypothetical protein
MSEVPAQRLCHPALLPLLESDLHRFVPVTINGLDLRDVARAGFDDRAGNHLTRIIEYAGHAQFFTE